MFPCRRPPTVKHNQVSDPFGLFMRQGGGLRGFVFKASAFIFVIKTLPLGLKPSPDPIVKQGKSMHISPVCFYLQTARVREYTQLS